MPKGYTATVYLPAYACTKHASPSLPPSHLCERSFTADHRGYNFPVDPWTMDTTSNWTDGGWMMPIIRWSTYHVNLREKMLTKLMP